MVKYRLITTIGLSLLLAVTFVNFGINSYKFFALKNTDSLDEPKETGRNYAVKTPFSGNAHNLEYYVPVQEGYIFKAIQPKQPPNQIPPMFTGNTSNLIIPSVYPANTQTQTPPPTENKDMEKPKDTLPDLALSGIVANDGGESIALIEENGGAITYIVKKGDFIKGEKLAEIGTDYIVLSTNKSKRRIELKKLP